MVRLVRLELTRTKARASKARMATYYITAAYFNDNLNTNNMVEDGGYAPPSPACKAGVFLVN